jgi:hypothetical protein
MGNLRFVFESYNLCLTAKTNASGSRFSYEKCSSNDQQGFTAKANGTLTLTNTDLCLAAMNMSPNGNQNEAGTGREVRATHKVRGLTLRPCSDGAPELIRWITIPE